MKIAVVSKKGGVGKTSTAVSLAAALAREGRRVLLIDLDPQASASQWLGVSRASLAPSAADLLIGDAPIAEVVRSTSTEGLDLVTASADLMTADTDLYSLGDRESLLARRLEPTAEDYDFVFFDCSPGLSLLPSLALVAADSFLLPVMPNYLALNGLDNLLQAVERLSFRNGTTCPCLGILLTIVDYRTRLTRQTVSRIRDEYGPLVFAIEIRTNVRLAEAPEFQQPIFEYDPTSTSAGAYALLAEEVRLRAESRPPRRERVRGALAESSEQQPATVTLASGKDLVEDDEAEATSSGPALGDERRVERPHWVRGLLRGSG